jgi:hypothetical protein
MRKRLDKWSRSIGWAINAQPQICDRHALGATTATSKSTRAMKRLARDTAMMAPSSAVIS